MKNMQVIIGPAQWEWKGKCSNLFTINIICKIKEKKLQLQVII